MLEVQKRKRKRKKGEEVDLPETRKVADVETSKKNHRTEHHQNGKTSNKLGERV
jgi:hypothetical protein